MHRICAPQRRKHFCHTRSYASRRHSRNVLCTLRLRTRYLTRMSVYELQRTEYTRGAMTPHDPVHCEAPDRVPSPWSAGPHAGSAGTQWLRHGSRPVTPALLSCSLHDPKAPRLRISRFSITIYHGSGTRVQSHHRQRTIACSCRVSTPLSRQSQCLSVIREIWALRVCKVAIAQSGKRAHSDYISRALGGGRACQVSA